VGEVLDFRYNDAVMPLVFSRGSYAVSVPQPPLDSMARRALPGDGFLANYLLYQLHRIYGSYSAELYPMLMSEFDVSPEEWRILTLLADVRTMGCATLAEMVSQPRNECEECLRRLAHRAYVGVVEDESGDESASISHAGAHFAAKLIEFARQHEQTVLRSLTVAQRNAIGDGLKTMLHALAG